MLALDSGKRRRVLQQQTLAAKAGKFIGLYGTSKLVPSPGLSPSKDFYRSRTFVASQTPAQAEKLAPFPKPLRCQLVQEVFDFVHFLVGQPQFSGPHYAVGLAGIAGAHDGSGDCWIAQSPGDRDLTR